MGIPKDGRYGQWAGNERGVPEDPTRCREEVPVGGRSVLFRQCSRRRNPNSLLGLCSNHQAAYSRRSSNS
jgi:hypothetical protein